MGGDFAAELLKLRKRPVVWVLGTALFFAVLLFGYALVYAFVTAGPADGGPADGTRAGARTAAEPAELTPEARGQIPDDLLPENLVANVLPTCSGFGKALALILGVVTLGGEYGWGTLKVVLTQRSSRTGIVFGKLLVMGGVSIGFVLLAFAAGVAGSYGVASVENAAVRWPNLGEAVEGAIVAWLILMAWAVLGAFLAALFRGTALAIGLGLTYALVLEPLVASSPVRSDALREALKLLPGASSNSLANAFDPAAQAGIGAHALSGSAGPAALTLVLFVVGFSLLAALLVRTRDVED